MFETVVFGGRTKMSMAYSPLYKKWRLWLFGPGRWSMPACDIDLRVGGKYRYVGKRKRPTTRWDRAANSLEVDSLNKYVADPNEFVAGLVSDRMVVLTLPCAWLGGGLATGDARMA